MTKLFFFLQYPNRSDEELRQLAQNNILNMYSSLVERQAMNRNPQQQNQYLPQVKFIKI